MGSCLLILSQTMMRFLFIALALVAGACAAQEEAMWKLYKAAYGKQYSSEVEESLRMKIFVENKKKIEDHNKLYEAGESTFKMGINRFADMPLSEYSAINNGYRRPNKPTNVETEVTFSDVTTTPLPIPARLDWRFYNMVTPIKNQGQCGSCWSFSATGALEGMLARHTGKLVSLSEQNLIDCTRDYNNAGCNGGWFENAWTYVHDNDGIDTEASYPYETRDDQPCRYDVANKATSDHGYQDLPTYDEKALLYAVGTVGPISVAIDATHDTFQFYKTGVYYEKACDQDKMEHAVLVVGYGNDILSGHDYWIVKNSWGTSWGEDGYIHMIRNKDNNCGIATHASYPTY